MTRVAAAALAVIAGVSVMGVSWVATADAPPVRVLAGALPAYERLGYGRDAALPPGANGWADARIGAMRGITVGPIESALHPDAGYGTDKGFRALIQARDMGATWVAITPFGRVWDLSGGGVSLVFEAPLERNTRDIVVTVAQAHALGLRVMLVPHLWVESGGWRALIDPGSDAGWARWAASYRRFVLYWAAIAEQAGVDMLSVGVELRSWVTTDRAPSFQAIIADVRRVYGGLLTYSGNWDDIADTVVLGDLDVIGVNAFYPLAEAEGADFATLLQGGHRVATQLQTLAETWQKPVLLTEMGYTTRPDPAVKPWEWPDGMTDVVVDEAAQAAAYRALIAPLLDRSWCAGLFVWRTYADPYDASQEAAWGFSPVGKLAELELRDAFVTGWASDGDGTFATWAGLAYDDLALHRRYGAHRARTPGVHAWELSPPPDSWWLR